jgi:hypothetical protein
MDVFVDQEHRLALREDDELVEQQLERLLLLAMRI